MTIPGYFGRFSGSPSIRVFGVPEGSVVGVAGEGESIRFSMLSPLDQVPVSG